MAITISSPNRSQQVVINQELALSALVVYKGDIVTVSGITPNGNVWIDYSDGRTTNNLKVANGQGNYIFTANEVINWLDFTDMATSEGNYFVQIQNATPTPTNCPKPVIASLSTDINITVGEAFQLVIEDNGTSRQWQKDGVAIAGEIAKTLVRTTSIASDAGTYKCIVKNECGSGNNAGITESPTIMVKVNAVVVIPPKPLAPTGITPSTCTVGDTITIPSPVAGTLHIFKDGVEIGTGIPCLVGNNPYSTTEIGSYTFKIETDNGVSDASTAVVVNAIAVVPPKPLAPTGITPSTCTVGDTITIPSPVAGTLHIFKDGVEIGTGIPCLVGNNPYSTTEIGSYTFKIETDNGVSDASTAVVVNAIAVVPPKPLSPTDITPSTCTVGDTITIPSPVAGILHIYNNGVEIGTGIPCIVGNNPYLTTTVSNNTTFRIETVVGGLSEASLPVTINAIPRYYYNGLNDIMPINDSINVVTRETKTSISNWIWIPILMAFLAFAGYVYYNNQSTSH